MLRRHALWTRHLLTLTCALGALAWAGCGDDDDGGDGDDTTVETDTGADTTPSVPTTWDEAVASGQQGAYMSGVVVPAMKDKFQEFDSAGFETFNCSTCHGSGASVGSFSMPNAELPPLGPADFAGTDAVHVFMQTEVVPTMAGLLGMDTFDPSTGEGFGCLGCHTSE